ncbi:hypothetical protein RBB50_011237 [Rhinocladiella similis]
MSLDMPRPDSDIFGHTPDDYSTKRVSPRPMPLSPTTRNDVRLNSTPPSEHNLPQPFDSPILPSPALKSSALYPRKSMVKGPRGHRTAGLGHLESSQGESPLRNKTATGAFYKSKGHLESGELDLRRSVMLMRSLNSENRLDSYTSFRSRTCCKDSIGVGVDQQMNSGLRTSSCASSLLTISPILERPVLGINLTVDPAIVSTSARSRQPSNSPPTISTGTGSIWEDDTVGGDADWAGTSTEDTPTPTPGTHLQLQPLPHPPALRPRPDGAREGRQHCEYHDDVQSLPQLGRRKFEGPESLWEVQAETKLQLTPSLARVPPRLDSGQKWHGHARRDVYGQMGPRNLGNTGAVDARGSYPSPLVRNLERAVSSGRWGTSSHVQDGVETNGNGRSGRSRDRAFTTTSQTDESSQGHGLGLGLRLGNGPLLL